MIVTYRARNDATSEYFCAWGEGYLSKIDYSQYDTIEELTEAMEKARIADDPLPSGNYVIEIIYYN